MCQALRELFADELREFQEEMEQRRKQDIEQSIEQGIEQGRQQGIKQGVEQGINSIIINMHTKNYSLQQISSITDKSISDIKLILEKSSIAI